LTDGYVARIAVCIPVYNGAAFVGQALESVAQQSHPDVLVIASDNASTDATPEILAEWSRRLPMRIIRRPRTLSMRDHFNALLDDVDAESYMLLCHDDYFASRDALAKAQATLDADPEISAVYSDLVYVSEAGRTLAHRRFGRDGRFRADDVGRQSIATARNCFGIPLAIRREVLGARRYDTGFLYVMDVDLSWSLSRERPPFHIPEPLIANRYSRQNSTWSMQGSMRREYIDLATKYGQRPGSLARMKIGMTCFGVTQQKRAFGLYERLRSWAD
jgi:glycosyltransferase involved in cell wall biosynthesis